MTTFHIEKSTLRYEDISVLRYRPAKPRGLVVWYHGWSAAAEGQELRALALAAAGFDTLVPATLHHDDRGSANYEAVESYPLFWECVCRNVTEADTWGRFATEAGYPGWYACGHSMGGFSALGVAARPDVHGVCALNGSGHWPLSRLFFAARFAAELPLLPALAEQVDILSPHRAAEALRHTPLLLLHGAADNLVDPRADERFAALVRQAGGDARYATIPDLGHYVTTAMLEAATSFFLSLATK
ncbi:MAG: prolyl oligopeptidase family serine peptidase [Veillonellaceae bacterium]|nr:prolyl oligopeptidase family serine peptidase [Veillonellaceae bacterium]